jgi:Outer membrane protein beta-barrel family/Carboxypeptidase regulatory-like domain
MTKKIFVLGFLLFLSAVSIAQTKKSLVKGRVADSTGNGIENASVTAVFTRDSTMAQSIMADGKGNFSMEGLEKGSYILYITHVSHDPFIRDFKIDDNSMLVDLGIIRMESKGVNLAEVIIRQPPVVLKTDTVEYNAGSFKVRQNATTEDLLKKLPGVQVDKSGNITAQGQSVTKVLVDGKPFFGNDPKLATQNLPANIVDKVQVIDKKSDQAAFTGIDDGNTEKTINIVIKRDKRKGYFGKMGGGIGTDNRYEGNLSLNRFNNGQQLSLISSANNTNKLGFSLQDMMDFSGASRGGGGMFGEGGGGGGGMFQNVSMGRNSPFNFGGLGGGGAGSIINGQSIGTNYTDAFGKKLTINANYFFNNSVTLQETKSSRQNFRKDSSFFTEQNSFSENRTTNHRFNFTSEWKIDSFNSLKFTPSFTYTEKSNRSRNENRNLAVDKSPQSSLLADNVSQSLQPSFNGNLLFRHSFRRKGRTFSANFNGGHNTTSGDGFNENDFTGFLPGGISFSNDSTQYNNRDNSSNVYGVRFAYTEPISKTRFLELNYNFNRNNNNTNQSTFDYNPVTGFHSAFNDSLSRVFDNTYTTQTAGFNVKTIKKKYDYTLGLSVQQAELNNVTKTGNSKPLTQQFTNLFPNAQFNYTFSRAKRLRIGYRGSTRQPSVSQLLPLIDNSNILSIRTGNPDLGQEFTNNFNAFFTNFNFFTFKSFFAFFNVSTTNNKIVNSITNSTFGKQVIKPVNANGAYNITANISMGLPFKKKKGVLLNTVTSVNYGRDISLVDNIKNYTRNLILNQSLVFNYAYKEKYDFSVTGGITYNQSSYTIQTAGNAEFLNYNFSYDFNYNFKKDWTFQTDIDFTANTGRSSGFNQQFTLWNASLSKAFLKKKEAVIRFSVFDLLKQNVSISRNVGDGYIEDIQSTILTQYFMLSFTYNLSRFGGKSTGFQIPKGIPGMRRMGDIRVN